MSLPIYQGIEVVRDDLLPGGTKSRYLHVLFDGTDEVAYASPVQGGAQIALAVVARKLGKRATIFCAARREWHLRTRQAQELGAKIIEVGPLGFLTVVQARAREYCAQTGAALAPFGMNVEDSAELIAAAALEQSSASPDEFWCAGGSGTLCRGLMQAWPAARANVVQVGHDLTNEVPGATIHLSKYRFAVPCKTNPPFPSDPHYDAKAWEMMLSKCRLNGQRVLFWNVL